MKATIVGIAPLLGLVVLAQSAQACTNCYVCSPALNVPLGRAPSPCGIPGFYYWVPGPTYYGTTYGPNYYLRPPFPPFNGILPGDMGKAIQTGQGFRPASHGGHGGGHPGGHFGGQPGGQFGGHPSGYTGGHPGGHPSGHAGGQPGGHPGAYPGPQMGGAAMPPFGMNGFPPGAFPPNFPQMGAMPGMPSMPGMAPMMPLLPPHIATPQGGPPNPQAITPVFPTHPSVRSPRDFFMWRENMEDRLTRETRPNLIP